MAGDGYGLTGLISGLTDVEGDTTPTAAPAPPVDLEPLIQPLVNCNDSHLTYGKVISDPMEAALLV